MRPRVLLLLIAAVAVLAAAAGGLAWRAGMFTKAEEPQFVGGPFQLVDQNGARVDERILRGKWSAVFFGFTYCPEACPTTLTTLGKAIDQLGPKGRDVQVVFVTVDPERDTAAQLKSYLSSPSFPKGTIGLTGSAGDIAKLARSYHVYYQKAGQGPDYSIDHSTILYLMNPKGRFSRVIAYGLTPDEVARQIAQAMQAA